MTGLTAATTKGLTRQLFLVACLLLSVSSTQAGAQSYKIVPSTTTVPAGDYGINIHALLVADTSPTPDVLLCVYTGYGSSAPIPASAWSTVTGGMEGKFDALPSTIQEVPPSAFTNGTFPAMMYTVPPGTEICTGASQAAPETAITLNLAYPAVASLDLASAPQQNPSLARRLPTRVEVFGSNFLRQTTSAYNSPSQVVFASTAFASTEASASDGTVDFISGSALQSTLPATLPSTATAVAITVCNTAVYSYCSAPYPLSLTPLQPEFGNIAASPPVAAPTQSVTLSSTFGTATPSVDGVPGGHVLFTENGAMVSSAQLLLDPTAVFVPAPKTSFGTSSSVSSPRPIVADFNKDGLPDVLFAEPGAVTDGKMYPIIHLLLGTTPTGQFAADLPYTGFSIHPCTTLLDLAVADFNADGYPDLAILCRNPAGSGTTAESVYVLLNMKNGTFVPTATAFGPVFASRILAADFNHDGRQDLVLAGPLDSAGDAGLQVLLGDDKGGLSLGPISTGLETAPSTPSAGFQIAAADLNNDGSPDIAILNAASSRTSVNKSIQIFQNDGTGTFTLATTVPTDGTATAGFSIAAIRPGGLPAVIVTSTGTSAPGISVALNTSAHNIAFSNTLKFTAVSGLAQAVAGDFTGDGLLDIAVTDATSTHVLAGDGDGLFTSAYSSLATAAVPSETLIAAADQNGDGYADLIAAVAGAASTTLESYIISGTASAATPGLKFATGVHHIFANIAGTVEIAPAAARTDLTVTGTGASIALYTSASSPLNYGNLLTLNAAITDPAATGPISFYNGDTLLGTAPLASNGTFAVAHFTPKLLDAGTYNFSASYAGDRAHSTLTSAPFVFVIAPILPTLRWVPAPASIGYGTPLSAAQLDAVAQVAATLPAPTGTYTYSRPLGSVLKIGPNPVSVTFNSTSLNYTDASASTSIAVVKAAPVIDWPTPADVIVDTLLSSTQLDASVTTPQGTELAGALVYTPVAGTKLSIAGAKQLSVLFTPTDTTDYTTATATVSINVGPIGISSIAPAAALLGDPATTVAVAGTGFSPTARVQIVGPALAAVMLPTTYLSSTRLSAIVPVSDLLTVQTLLLSVVDPTKDLPSNSVAFIVTAPSTTVGVNAPASISPASQNTVIFHLAAYPAPVTANFTIAFKPGGTLPDDPGIVFVDSGLRTASVTVPAHAEALDLPITFQSGTISGTLTLTLLLDAGGANVTPVSIQPIVIAEPVAVPGISSVTLVPNGKVLTVITRGFSNTRDIAGATFHFTPVPGHTIITPVFNLDVTALFSTWYANPESDPYGSLFTYTEVFNLSSDASVVKQVTVTLTNDVGASQEANTQ